MASDDPGFATRLGLAIVAPRWAFAVADDPRHAGRPGSDLLRTFALLVLAVHTRALVVAVWLAAILDVGAGLRAVMTLASSALTRPLAFLVVGTVIVWAAAGRGRSLGRVFDLACVALVPLLAIELVGTLVLRGLDLAGAAAPTMVRFGLETAGFTWSGMLLALAVVHVRRHPQARRARGPS